MLKWIKKLFKKMSTDEMIDLVLEVAEDLAARTETEVDDNAVLVLRAMFKKK